MIPPTVTLWSFRCSLRTHYPHLVTTFSTRNVTTHVLQTSGRIAPNIYLFGPAHQMFRVLPAGCLSLWSCPRGSIV